MRKALLILSPMVRKMVPAPARSPPPPPVTAKAPPLQSICPKALSPPEEKNSFMPTVSLHTEIHDEREGLLPGPQQSRTASGQARSSRKEGRRTLQDEEVWWTSVGVTRTWTF
ncbi:hypothetical protein MPTK1_2g18410 [Marchantia polymorpha subsp. ruderalis]|uniref:Uncharacterized protein n=1 Tax=Marchantia polymorpha TaxID=3197 RepID=A0A2R6W2D7_MARPO|nr:hypothetical protein MARPO_0177s0020 [Marchantia polymorpha]BBN02823.1 hypothetical protein Mp_2g18410 [Marchantia polymorpha subsp. ruderalis]|eukprot:PTQ28009.1 hypothetical protein MARPO_0177s0020 [Marchantia polymorpha]